MLASTKKQSSGILYVLMMLLGLSVPFSQNNPRISCLRALLALPCDPRSLDFPVKLSRRVR